jgi:protein TonB
MSYVDQNNGREKSLSGIGSALVVAGIGYALVTGLAINIVTTTPPNLLVHDYTPDTQPPPPEHRQVKPTARTTTTPATTIPTPLPKAPDIDMPKIDLTPFTLPKLPGESLGGTGPGATGADTKPAGTPIAATPKGAPGEWVTTDDYPQAALRAGAQGRTSFRLDIGADGRVTDCTVSRSSGSADLDDAACRVLRKRARFTAARDAGGNATAGSYESSVVWKLPSE